MSGQIRSTAKPPHPARFRRRRGGRGGVAARLGVWASGTVLFFDLRRWAGRAGRRPGRGLGGRRGRLERPRGLRPPSVTEVAPSTSASQLCPSSRKASGSGLLPRYSPRSADRHGPAGREVGLPAGSTTLRPFWATARAGSVSRCVPGKANSSRQSSPSAALPGVHHGQPGREVAAGVRARPGSAPCTRRCAAPRPAARRPRPPPARADLVRLAGRGPGQADHQDQHQGGHRRLQPMPAG